MPVSRRLLALLCPLLVLLSACRVERNPMPETLNADSASRADIRATMEAYRLALLDNDARTIASFFTADAQLMEPGMEDVVGVDAVRQTLDGFFDNGGTITGVSVESEDVHVDGGVAFDIGRYSETFRMDTAGEQTVRGRYMIRWRRGEEARWRIDRFLLNHYPADSVATDTLPAPPG